MQLEAAIIVSNKVHLVIDQCWFIRIADRRDDVRVADLVLPRGTRDPDVHVSSVSYTYEPVTSWRVQPARMRLGDL